VVLRDGSTVHIRPISPEDKAALSQAFDRLGEESRYRRFLSAVKRLDARTLEYFTEVDHVSHEALIAIDPDDGELVGVARYVRLSREAEAAEVAMVVADGWGGRGLATVLLSQLTTLAQAAGVVRFVATCLTVNRDATRVLTSLGPTQVEPREGGVEELSIELSAQTAENALQVALGHVARGELAVQLKGT
jgi:RimJ/RimL family protein N-acetyltransferase